MPLIAPAHATPWRSLAKTVSWRALASLDTFLLSYLITGRLLYAGSIASAEVVTKVVFYYLHERAWAHVDWGFRGLRRIVVRKSRTASGDPAARNPGP